MYQDQGRSNQAKLLREMLKVKGLYVSHAQSMEMMAKLEGHRTLHVAHAQPKTLVVMNEVAILQAQAVMFESLGHYKGRIKELMADLRELQDCEVPRELDQLYRSIFRDENPVVLAEHLDNLRAEEVPLAFDRLVDKLRKALLESAGVSKNHEETLFDGRVYDWTKGSGASEDDAEQFPAYSLSIKRDGSQFYIELVPADSKVDDLPGKKQLGLFIEVNQGLPCVHLTNDVLGDQVLTVFGLRDGLYLRPADGETYISTGRPTPGTDLADHDDWERREPFDARMTRNHAYIERCNAD